ncbi:MAG: hypothetical protein Q27BB25_00845 [Blastomonas sp. CACIA14H2]|nr:MAG: hypothetical protein Q27BB25_00845 [Blastomonas sp. CACIA14H2]
MGWKGMLRSSASMPPCSASADTCKATHSIERLRPVRRLDAQHALPPAHQAWRSSHPCPIDAKRRCIEARR